MKNIREYDDRSFDAKERILQFGEGNFLRAFADWMIDFKNEKDNSLGKVVIVQPIEQGISELINEQDGKYTLSMRGRDEFGPKVVNRVITSVSRAINPYENFEDYEDFILSEDLRIVISNTTEAGIAYKEEKYIKDSIQDSFPAKVTQLLYKRFKKYNGDRSKGLLFLPVELIDNNGYELKKYVLQHSSNWNLGKDFIDWINEANEFASTLVDRIVTGRPRDKERDDFNNKSGYEDKLLVFSELFNLWVVEGDLKWKDEFNFDDVDSNLIWTEDVTPYKKRKVRILNGGHTSTVPAALLSGYTIVREFMEDDIFKNYLNKLIEDEVIPTIELDREDLINFKNEVNYRFENPYIDHKLIDICLNSISKYNARCLPSVVDYVKNFNKVPKRLAFSLAALIKLYDLEKVDNKYFTVDEKGNRYEIKDDIDILEFFANTKNIDDILKADFWKVNFDALLDFKIVVKKFYEDINKNKIKGAIENIERLSNSK